jgi:hypothetical protein
VSNEPGQYTLAYFQATLAVIRTLGILVYKYKLSKLQVGPFFAAGGLLAFAAAEAVTSHFQSFAVMLPAFAIGVFCLSWYFPLRQAAFHQAVGDSNRATMVSLDSMLTNISSAAVCTSMGMFASNSLGELWAVAAAALGVVGVAYIGASDRNKSSMPSKYSNAIAPSSR